jgi:4-hydroxy-3-methylbut-2-enyl diphosphate reductase
MKDLKIILAAPRGFCAGVHRAIDIVEKALDKYGPPIYVRHEIVHNRFVVESLKAKGVIFVEETSAIPKGAVAIFSAHGVSDKVEEEAKAGGLDVIDATCPLVTKVHMEARKHEREGRKIIMIGHPGHAEVEGTTGKVKQEVRVISSETEVELLPFSPDEPLAYVTQTTLSVDDTAKIIEALKKKFPNIVGPSSKDICYATQNRQQAVKILAKHVELILIIGSKNSSNSNRLRDVGLDIGVPSYLIDDVQHIDPQWFEGISCIGMTAGASAPEALVNQVIDYLKCRYNVAFEELEGAKENVRFPLPKKVLYPS